MQSPGKLDSCPAPNRTQILPPELDRLQPQPGKLLQIAREAYQALALLDAVRLEELALACQKLNRDLASLHASQYEDLTRQAHAASAEMAIFARILDATRANLEVMRRLRALREGGFEYSRFQGSMPESVHGHD